MVVRLRAIGNTDSAISYTGEGSGGPTYGHLLSPGKVYLEGNDQRIEDYLLKPIEKQESRVYNFASAIPAQDRPWNTTPFQVILRLAKNAIPGVLVNRLFLLELPEYEPASNELPPPPTAALRIPDIVGVPTIWDRLIRS
jgi:hypothetical protein